MRNTKDLVEEVSTGKVEPGEVLVNFDVKSHTSVPVAEALQAVDKKLQSDYS